jgi:plasmid stabilization system protein ParE
MRLVYSVEAVADLVRLRTFITAHDPTAAARIADELVTRVSLVCRFPEMGKTVPIAPDPEIVRDAIFGKYVVRYTIHPSSIVILRIWHRFEDRTSGI